MSTASVRVNLVFADNGQGLSRDAHVLAEAMRFLGYTVTRTGRSPLRPPINLRFARERLVYDARRIRDAVRVARSPRIRWDLNIFLESIDPAYLPLARRNWFVPNQEWLASDNVAVLSDVDLVLFKTRHAEQTLSSRARRSAFIGFTSLDRRLAGATSSAGSMLHVAGWNPYKGTSSLLELWRQHPDWPRLTAVTQTARVPPAANLIIESRRLSDRRLRDLQNCSAIHVAPSEVEGFGHSLVEALSCGAIVITTDAPPMNEVVGSSGAFLVEVDRSEPMGSGTRYLFRTSSMEAAIEGVSRLTAADRERLGRQSRAAYEDGRDSFVSRLKELLESEL